MISSNIDWEYKRISDLIDKTPRGKSEEIKRFHSLIKQEVDSGKIIPIPSFEHRMLHQKMWIDGFMIYNGYSSMDDATIHFFEKNCGQHCENPKCQKIRFDIWYAGTYLNGNTDDWAMSVRESADREAREHCGKELSELVIKV